MENISNYPIQMLSTDEINKIEEFRKSKNTAVLTILFSDIVNSTSATEKLGEKTYSKLRHIHDELFIRIMSRDNAGIIIKEIGDSFICAFAEPSTAVLRAIEFQKTINLNKENLTIEDYTLTVRIGIHVGQVAVENNLSVDIFGRHVNRAARIESIASGGQILTSQAVWDNASGWLKDNKEEKIGWIAYGKIKLKGIDDKIDVYGFYSKDIGNLSIPAVFKKQKQKKSLVIMILFILFGLLTFLAVNKIHQLNKNTDLASMKKSKKTYYIQFDFSDLARHTLKKGNINLQSILDTNLLKEELLSEAISVFYPDSVISESDLIKSLSQKGKFFSGGRYENNYFQEKYFRDTLGLYNTIFVNADLFLKYEHSIAYGDPHGISKIQLGGELNDSILFIIITDFQTVQGQDGASYASTFSMKNIKKDFRNFLQDILMELQMIGIQGYVLNCNDSLLFFRINKDANLKIGSRIRFERNYTGKEGVKSWLDDVKKRIEFFKDKPEFVIEYNYAKTSYDYIKNHLYTYANLKDNQRYTDLIGKVIDIYDSTGKVKWSFEGNYLLEKPRKGDIIYLTY